MKNITKTFFNIKIVIKHLLKFLKKIIYKNINLLNYIIYKIKSKSTFNTKDLIKNKFSKSSSISKNRKIIFIYRSQRRDNASTVMRSFQLQKILKEEGGINAEIFDESYINNIRNSICILNKSFLIDASSKELEILNSNGNILCLDYIDSKDIFFQVQYAHCLIASSIKQLKFYQKKYKNKLIRLVTHHVDPRLPKEEK